MRQSIWQVAWSRRSWIALAVDARIVCLSGIDGELSTTQRKSTGTDFARAAAATAIDRAAPAASSHAVRRLRVRRLRLMSFSLRAAVARAHSRKAGMCLGRSLGMAAD